MAWTNPKTWSAGETLTAANFNLHIRDNELALGPHLIARKTSDQSVTSSTVLVDDSALQLAVGASEVWKVEVSLLFEGDTTGDLKFSFSFPTSGVCYVNAAHQDAALATSTDLLRLTVSDGTTMPLGCLGAGSPRYQPISALFVNSTTAGTLIFRWAQNASSATATKVVTNSTLWAVKLA